jgi:raw
MEKKIFLGGSCNPTTWRREIVIPILDASGVAFYNPQVDDWHEGLVKVEAEAKTNCEVLLFVIDKQTRAVASLLEATEYVVTGRKVLLVVNDIDDGTEIDGQAVTGRELKDLNRARAYLRDVASRYDNAQLFESVEQAVESAKGQLAV